LDCGNCGYDNNADAQFCKKCCADLRIHDNFINKINTKINVLAIFIGLFVSVLVLFIGATSFGGVVITGTDNSIIYIGMVFLAMSFFGAVVTGLIGPKTIYDGSVNGAFLSLIVIVFSGFVVGIILFALIGVTESIANALHSAFGGLASAVPTTSTLGSNLSINPIMFILIVVLNLAAGIVGGCLGVFIKEGIKQILK
jgi:hypothetical protein